MTAPWFPFFTADWIVGVTSLSAAERGVYISLIARIYDSEGPIRHDDNRLARECGLPVHGFRRALAALIESGKLTHVDGMIFNERAKIELTERRNRSLTAKRSADLRWGKDKINQHADDAIALPMQCDDDASRARVLQSQSHTKDTRAKTRAVDSRFETFWRAWPNKVGKPAAEKAFKRVASQLPAILSGLDRYIKTKPSDREWLNPATFLNQRRWEDQPAVLPMNGGPSRYMQTC